jgi:hypothetical protein
MRRKRVAAARAHEEAPAAGALDETSVDCGARAGAEGLRGPDSVGHDGAGARGGESQAALAGQWQLPSTFRELGSAIFSRANPVKVGAELLDPGDRKADATRLNALKTFAEWVFGKPGGEPQRKPLRAIWDLPCPPYEPLDPLEPQNLEGEDE